MCALLPPMKTLASQARAEPVTEQGAPLAVRPLSGTPGGGEQHPRLGLAAAGEEGPSAPSAPPEKGEKSEQGSTRVETGPAPPFEYEELFLDVDIAGYYQRAFVFTVVLPDKGILVSRKDLEPLPFRAGAAIVIVSFLDTDMIDVNATAGLSATLDTTAGTLRLRADPSLLSPFEKDFDPKPSIADLPPRALGAHLNYSLGWTGNKDEPGLPSGFFQGFWYRDRWTVRSSFAANEQSGFQRLASTVLFDNPETLRKWALGDVVAPAGTDWGTSRNLLGVSWGTDFTMDPGFTPFQDYSIFGSTELPAVAEIMSQGVPIRQIELPPGPFAFQNIAVPDPYGNLVVRVTDRVGKESFFEVPYVRIGRLYKAGLYDYNLTAGLREENTTGIWGSRYFGFGASTTHRYGFSETLTGELHAEATEVSAALGVSATQALLPLNLLYTAALAVSQSPEGSGLRAALGLDRAKYLDGPFMRIGLVFHSPDFSLSPVTADDRDPPRLDLRLNPTFGGSGFPVSFNYQYSDTWNGGYKHSFGISYGVNLGPLRVGLTASHVNGQDETGQDISDISAFLTLSLPFGEGRRLASSTFSLQNNQVSAGAQFTQYAPTDSGLGYQLAASAADLTDGKVDQYAGFVEWNSGIGRGSARISHQPEQNSLSYGVNFSGSVGFFDGQAFLARSLDGPYALVRTGEATDLPIYLNRNPVQRSNAKGWAVLNGMLPFSRNRVEFKPEDLNFDIDLADIAPHREVVTWDYGGVLVDFPLRVQLPVTLVLRDATGKPLPAGTRVTNSVNGEEAYVALKGEVFLRQFTAELQLEVDASNFGACQISARRPEGFQAFDSMEPLSCTLR